MDDLLYSILLIGFWAFVCWLVLRNENNIKWDKKANYNRYISSPQWRNRRRVILSRDNYRCRHCGATKSLQVHHLTYEHFGNEQSNELITLCSRCHHKVHGKYRRA